MAGICKHFGDELEMECKGNSMESMIATLVKIPSNGGHRAWNGPFFVTRQGLKWKDWNTNTATKLSNYILSCLHGILGLNHSRISSKRPKIIHPTTDRRRCRIPQSNGTQCLWSPVEKWEEELEESEIPGTPWEHDPQNSLIMMHGGSQRSSFWLTILGVKDSNSYHHTSPAFFTMKELTPQIVSQNELLSL